jgi:hypothetical protein
LLPSRSNANTARPGHEKKRQQQHISIIIKHGQRFIAISINRSERDNAAAANANLLRAYIYFATDQQKNTEPPADKILREDAAAR